MGGGTIVSASRCAGFRRCDRDRNLTLVCKIEIKKEFAPYPELFLQKRLWLYEHFTSCKSYLKTCPSLLCSPTNYEWANKQMICLNALRKKPEPLHPTVFITYWEFQRRCIECITWQRTERKKKSRTPEAQWEVGPWGLAALTNCGLFEPSATTQEISSGLVLLFLVKRSPQCCWTRALRQRSTEGSLSSARNAHRFIRTFCVWISWTVCL